MEPLPALNLNASTINPTTNNLVLALGTEETEVVTVTIPKQVGVNKADVYLLADTTGSMGSIVEAVKAGANEIIGRSFEGVDVAFGVGNYRDFPDTKPPFIHQAAPTTDKEVATQAIQNWSVAGGGDHSEGQLYALNALATEASDSDIGWRSDSKRIIVWFGDAPGHDPICQAMSGLDFDITEALVRARLVEEEITVIAISVSGNGLDANPMANASSYRGICEIGGSAGQATRIADETGGKHVTGINPDEIVNTIIELVEAAIKDVGEVKLVPSADIAPFVASITPPSFTNLPGEEEHVLTFTVNCHGVQPCAEDEVVIDGAMHAVADGATIATQTVQVSVPKCDPLRLTRFILVNAETNEDIRILLDNDTLDMSTLPSALNVRVEAGDAVQCVEFNTDPRHDQQSNQENLRPFSLFGDTSEGFNAGSFENGTHSLRATPFSERRARGEQGNPLSISINVING